MLAQAFLALEAVNKAKDAMGHYRSLNIENTLFENVAHRIESEINFKITTTGLWFPPLPERADITVDALCNSGVGKFEATLRHWIVDQFQEREVHLKITKDKLVNDVFETTSHLFDQMFHPKPGPPKKKSAGSS